MSTTTTITTREALTDTVLPAMRTGLTIAREKGNELLASDAAQEAKRRGAAMLLAARGEPVVETRRRWLRGIALLSLGAGIGAALAWTVRRMSAPVESYRMGPMPVPPGDLAESDTGRTADDIDLRAGSSMRR